MEHVVFFTGADGAAQHSRTPSLEEAVRVVEHLRNVEGVEDARVYALTEVPLAFKTVYRVEIPGQSGEVPAPLPPMPPMPDMEIPGPEAAPEAPAEPEAQAAPEAPAEVPEPVMAAGPSEPYTVAEPAPSNGGRTAARGMGFFSR